MIFAVVVLPLPFLPMMAWFSQGFISILIPLSIDVSPIHAYKFSIFNNVESLVMQ